MPAFREPHRIALVGQIETFRGTIAGFRWPLSESFRKAADAWLVVAKRQLEAAARAGSRADCQVFRAGDPSTALRRRSCRACPSSRSCRASHARHGLPRHSPLRSPSDGQEHAAEKPRLRTCRTTIAIASLSMQDPRAFTTLGDLVRSLGDAVGKAAGVEASPGGED